MKLTTYTADVYMTIKTTVTIRVEPDDDMDVAAYDEADKQLKQGKLQPSDIVEYSVENINPA